jgi:FtsP/CotA-like multicopper oxidase with cupredoxin domain
MIESFLQTLGATAMQPLMILLILSALQGIVYSSNSSSSYNSSDANSAFVRYPTFKEPAAYYAVNGHLEVTLQVEIGRVNTGPYLFNARMYNGSLPGPTLYVRPGDHLSITVVNILGPQNYSDYDLNSMHDYNTTNLHTHGLHVPAKSDDVFISIDPSQSFTYEYDICDDHYPGTHMYHPHHRKFSDFAFFRSMFIFYGEFASRTCLHFEHFALQLHRLW